MPRQRKGLSAFFIFAFLTAAGLWPLPAWSQSAQQDDEDRLLETREEQTESAGESNGLRGRLEPEQEESGRSQRPRRAGEEILRQSDSPDTLPTSRTDPLNPINPDVARNSLLSRNPDNLQNPLLDTREDLPRDRDREEDPYAALGIRLGSFLLFPELSAETVYDDNIFLSGTNQEGDWALALTPSLRIDSDWSRHSLSATLSGERNYHDRFSTEDEKTFSAGVTGQLDILRNTNLVATANYSQFLEDRSSTDFPANASERPKTHNRDASLEGNHTFNRVTLTLRGETAEEDFSDSTAVDGSLINNDDRDFTERRVTGRVAYEFQPGVSAFVESSANERDFKQPIDDDGTANGSSGHDIQGGLSFLLTGKLTGEASAGYAIQNPDDASLGDVDGLIFNSALEWRATGLTTVRLDASSEVAETTNTGSAGSIVRAAEISVEHRPRRHIILGASLGYELETFSGSDQEDKEWAAGLTGEYIITRSVALTLDYEHLKSWSNVPGSDYTTDEVRFGVRVRR